MTWHSDPNTSASKCKCCGEWVEEDHRCFIQPVPEKPALDAKKSWYAFDLESDISGSNHVVNASGWQRLDLGNEKVEDKDYSCEYRRGSEALADFVRFAVGCKNTTFVAHNGAGYDFLLVAEEIFKQTGIRAKQIRAGGKVMRMDFRSVRFIDSCRHVPGKLSSFPKTFGLNESVRKGFYPYAFNTAANIGYKGPIPGKEFFLPARMSKEDRVEFDEWYDSVKNDMYDLEYETKLYQENDVLILKLGLGEYVKGWVKTSEMNPLESTTVAGAVQMFYLSKCLKPGTLAVLNEYEANFVREGFFGGRTEIFNDCFKLTQGQIAAGFRIGYHDVVSEYPTVL